MLIKISLTPERQLLTEIGRSPDFPRKTRLPGLLSNKPPLGGGF